VAQWLEEHDLLHRKETSLSDEIARPQAWRLGRITPHLSRSREVLWIASGQIGAVLAALAGLTWLTKFLPPSDYGQLALMLSLANLVGLVIFGPLAAAGSRFLEPAREQHQHPALLLAIARLIRTRSRMFGLGTLLAVIVGGLVGGGPAAAFVLLAALFAIGLSMITVLEAILNAGRLRREVALHRALQQLLNYGLALGLVAVWTPSALVAMLGFVVGVTVTVASEVRVLRRSLWPASAAGTAPDVVGTWREKVIAYARPYERWGGLQWLQTASDRWALLFTSGVHDAGLYAVVYQLGYTPLGLLANLLVQTIEPVAFARAGDASTADRLAHAQRLRRTTMKLFGGAVALAVAAAFLLHGFVFRVVVDPAYASVSPLLPWMALAAGLFGTAQLQAVKWLILVQPGRMERARLVLSTLGIAIIVTGAAVGGLSGVAAGQVLSSLLFLIGMIVLR
jgi:O-antigen/teichoic acid export membrane protein